MFLSPTTRSVMASVSLAHHVQAHRGVATEHKGNGGGDGGDGVGSGKGVDSKTFEETLEALYLFQSNTQVMAQWVNDRKTDPSTNRLQFMRDCVKMVNIDVDDLSIIHVAGTKGKGSTCAFVESILRHHGLKTGLFTSPHLQSPCERIRLNGRPISEEKFVNYFWDVFDLLKKSGFDFGEMGNPTLPFFYFMTLMGFKAFFEEKVDVAIIEVGIGGGGDATNIINNPVCTGITALDYDHMNVMCGWHK